MFATGFQSFAFQTVGGGVATPTGHGGYVHVTPYQRYKQNEHERTLEEQRLELQRVDDELADAEQKRLLASEQKLLASKRQSATLAKLEQQYLQEISQLLMVRADLVRRVRQSEELLILMIAMNRRRFRVANWQATAH